MSHSYEQDFYIPAYPQKYVGTKPPRYKSSWEKRVMIFFDHNPNVINWAYEPIKIPYQNPFTAKYTVYVPDFIVTYVDTKGNRITEIIEVKPAKETFLERAKSQKAKAAVALNTYKWEAARSFAMQRGIGFRVMVEENIFNNPHGKG